MSKVQTLRAFVNQRLTAAADEIFELFERTIAEYEEELFNSTENHRQQKLLDDVFNHEVRSHRADVQQLSVVEEEVPSEQQEWSSSLDQEHPEPPHIKEEQEDPEPPHIKEDQEELCTSQEEADIKFRFSSVPVKNEEDEEKPQCSQLLQRQTEQMETEADGEDCGGPESDSLLNPATHDKTSHSESETDDSRDWEQTKKPQSVVQNNEVPVSEMESNTGKTSVSSSECAGSFDNKGHLQKHTGIQTQEKPISCSVCNKRFARPSVLRRHMTVHTGEKPFSCSVCGQRFTAKQHLKHHSSIHTGEKPFSCSVCDKRFAKHSDLRRHLTVHTGERPFSCSVCGKRFTLNQHLRRHLTVHTRDKAFSCSIGDKRVTRVRSVKSHKCVGESSGKK